MSNDWVLTDLENVPVKVLQIEPTQDNVGFAKVCHFQCGKKIYSFLRGSHLDTLDVAYYFQQPTGEVMILAYQTVRLAPRTGDFSESDGSSVSIWDALEWCLPATYLRLDEGLTSVEAALGVLRDKLGVTHVGDFEMLGVSGFPSSGSSLEHVAFRMQRVLPPDELDSMKVGQRYEPVLRRKFFKLQEVVDGFFAGTIRDLRLVLAALRLAEHFGVRIDVDLNLPQPEWYGDKALGQTIAETIDPPTQNQFTRLEEVRSTEGDFLKMQSWRIQNTNGSGVSIDEPYVVETVNRVCPDAVDVFGYGFHEGELCVSFHIGERPAMLARQHFPLALNSTDSLFHVEPVSRVIPAGADLSKIAAIALSGLKQEAGLEADEVGFVSPWLCPSPGILGEKVRLAFVPLSGQSSSTPAVVEVDTLLSLCKSGVVRDLRLELGVRLLKLYFDYASSSMTLGAADTRLRREFSRRLSGTARLPALLSSSPDLLRIHSQLSSSPIYRKQCILVANKLGLWPLDSNHPLDRGAFSPILPRFAVPEMNDKRRLAFYLLHDMHHYLLGDVVPYAYDDQGRLALVPFDDYRALASAQECRAVWYSDVLIPHIIGFEKAREIFGSPSTAEAFDRLGISKEEAYGVILSIERDGVIPQNVLRHSEFGQYKSLFVDRMLRYHFMDAAQIHLVYEFWMERPELVSHVLDFSDTYTATSAYTDSFEVLLRRLEDPSTTDGYNSLREVVSALRNTELRSLALRLAVYKDILIRLKPSGWKEAEATITDCLATVKIAYDELEKRGDRIVNTDANDANFIAFVYERAVRMRLIPKCRALLEQLETTSAFLELEQFSAQVGRVLSFVPPVNLLIDEILPAEKLMEMVQDRYQQLLEGSGS